MAAEIHQTAHGKGDNVGRLEIPIGTRAAEAGNRSHNQCRVDGLETVVVKTQLFQIPRRLVFDQHVGNSRELLQGVSSLLAVQIQHDPAFAGMIRREGKAPFGIGQIIFKRPFAPRQIAFRRLDENHLRAKVGQQPAAITALSAGEIENPQPGERARGIQFSSH